MKNSPETLHKKKILKRAWKTKSDPNSFPKFIRKKCKDCGRVKYCEWQSSFTQTGKPEYRARCVDCHSEHRKSHRRAAQAKIFRNKSRRAWKLKRKQYAVDRLGGKCVRCGHTRLSSLTFHHLAPEIKEIDIGAALIDFSIERLNRELDKCQLLCANCHMDLHEELENKKGGSKCTCYLKKA